MPDHDENAPRIQASPEDLVLAASARDKRAKGKRMTVAADWRKLLDAHLATQLAGKPDELEESARAEKTAALNELAEARLSVLIGPAGTGKTTLLSVLCSHPKVEAGEFCCWHLPEKPAYAWSSPPRASNSRATPLLSS